MEVRLTYSEPPLIVPMGKNYSLSASFTVRYVYGEGEEKLLVVPMWYLSDGASVPRALWSLIGSPYNPQFIAAAIVHDYCCTNLYDQKLIGLDEMSSLFQALLVRNGIGSFKAWTMEKAVKVYKKFF